MTTENLPPLPDEEDTILPPLEDAENLPPLPEEIPADTGDSPLPPPPAEDELPLPPPPAATLAPEPMDVLPQPPAPGGKNSASKLPLILAAGLCLGGFGIYMVSSGSDSGNVSSFSAPIPSVSPDEAIEMLKRYGIIDQYATGDMVTTQRFTAHGSHMGKSYKSNPIKALSEDLLRHFAMYKDGVEKLNDYPYVDKIIELYRRANTVQEEMQAQGLAKMTDDLNEAKEAMANAFLGVDTPDPAPQAMKQLPVQCLKAFTAKGCTIADFEACRTNIEKVAPLDEKLIQFIFSELCGTSKHLLNTPDKDSWTPLMTAARFYTADICRELIKEGADVHAKGSSGQTPLMIAVGNRKNEDVVDVLLKAGADVNAKDNNAFTSLLYAATLGTANVCQKFIDAGADKNATDKNGRNALMLAAESNTSDVCQKLIEVGMDVNVVSPHGNTPLMLAAQKNTKDECRVLIDAGADINARDEKGRTALMRAALNIEHKAVFDYLIEAGADVNILDNEGRTLLLQVYEDEDYEGIKEKIVNRYLNTGRTPSAQGYTLDEAENIKTILVDKLLQAKADTNIKDKNGNTILTLALKCCLDGSINNIRKREGSGNLINKIVNAGGRFDTQDPKNCATLKEIICSRFDKELNMDVIADLIRAGADVNVRDTDGWTPLMYAVRYHDTETCKRLIELGADVNAKNNDGFTPIMLVTLNQFDQGREGMKYIDLLIENGADLNIQANNGRTLLMISVRRGLWEKVYSSEDKYYSREVVYFPWKDLTEKLIESKVDFNLKDEDGESPLLQILRKFGYIRPLDNEYDKYIQWVKKMMANGGDIEDPDEDGKTFLMRVLENLPEGDIELLVQGLIKVGVNVNALDNKGWSPLMYAKHYKKEDAYNVLVKHGARLSAGSASMTRDVELDGMIQKLKSIEYFSGVERTQQERLLQLLAKIKSGASLDVVLPNTDGATALHYACALGRGYIVLWLIENGADVNKKTTNGKLADDFIKKDGYSSLNRTDSSVIIELLQDARQGKKGTASAAGNDSVSSGAESQNADELGEMIRDLERASYKTAVERLYQKRLLQLLPLIKNGESVDVVLPDMNGTTALHNACGLSRVDIVRWLVDHGANLDARTAKGVSVETCVGGSNAAEISQILREARQGRRGTSSFAGSDTYSAGNDAEELNNLGLAYQYGNNGKPQNYSEAARHFRLAAERGHAGAQNNLGFCYHNGWGVPKDMSQAAMWYKCSADQGNAWGQSNYGTCLEFGWGVRKNVSAAIEMYRRAAAQGHASAKKHLKRHGITM